MDPGRGHQGGEALDELKRREQLRARPAWAGLGGKVEQVPGIAPLQALEGERRAGALAQQLL